MNERGYHGPADCAPDLPTSYDSNWVLLAGRPARMQSLRTGKIRELRPGDVLPDGTVWTSGEDAAARRERAIATEVILAAIRNLYLDGAECRDAADTLGVGNLPDDFEAFLGRIVDLVRTADITVGWPSPAGAETAWRVQWISDPFGDGREREEGYRDFTDGTQARVWYEAERKRAVDLNWRIELRHRVVPGWTLVAGSGYAEVEARGTNPAAAGT